MPAFNCWHFAFQAGHTGPPLQLNSDGFIANFSFEIQLTATHFFSVHFKRIPTNTKKLIANRPL